MLLVKVLRAHSNLKLLTREKSYFVQFSTITVQKKNTGQMTAAGHTKLLEVPFVICSARRLHAMLPKTLIPAYALSGIVTKKPLPHGHLLTRPPQLLLMCLSDQACQ